MPDPIHADQSKTNYRGELIYTADSSAVFPGETGVRVDFDARYRVEDMPGVAFYLTGYYSEPDGYYSEPDEDTEWSGIENVDETRVRAVMVGDDREHIVDVSDLRKLDEDEYCSCCGQLGCGWG